MVDSFYIKVCSKSVAILAQELNPHMSKTGYFSVLFASERSGAA